jgi:hypothetical protein
MKKFIHKLKSAKKVAGKHKGIFKLNMYLIALFPKLYAKWLVHDKEFTSELYAKSRALYFMSRYALSMTEDKDYSNTVISYVAQWMLCEHHTCLLNMLGDLFVTGDEYTTGNHLYIVTLRPGMWIGKGGKIIDSLRDSLRAATGDKDFTVDIIETECNMQTLTKACEEYGMDSWNC